MNPRRGRRRRSPLLVPAIAIPFWWAGAVAGLELLPRLPNEQLPLRLEAWRGFACRVILAEVTGGMGA